MDGRPRCARWSWRAVIDEFYYDGNALDSRPNALPSCRPQLRCHAGKERGCRAQPLAPSPSLTKRQTALPGGPARLSLCSLHTRCGGSRKSDASFRSVTSHLPANRTRTQFPSFLLRHTRAHLYTRRLVLAAIQVSPRHHSGFARGGWDDRGLGQLLFFWRRRQGPVNSSRPPRSRARLNTIAEVPSLPRARPGTSCCTC